MDNIKLLIISFYFPPFKRVGGRRWAKHCKYLNRLGINVSVLAGEFPNSNSSWDDDILEYKDKISRINLNPVYKPYFLTTLPRNLLDKVRWKFSYLIWQFRKNFFFGNYRDVSLPNKEMFYQKAKQLIKEKGISTIILSIGPFAYSDILIKLKAEFPLLNYVVDYRDTWEESLEGLTENQKKVELEKQLSVLKTVDLVMTVNEDISQKIRNIYNDVKVITLPHSVDEDFLHIAAAHIQEPNREVIGLVYGGELYSGLENEMKNYITFCDLLSEKTEKKCESNFYSPYFSYESILKSKVGLHPMLLKDKYQEVLSKSDFIILFKSPLSSEAFFSSKFYEILCLRKTILFFGNKGIVANFIEDQHLGYHVRSDNFQNVILEIIENFNTKVVPNKSYDLSKHSFEFHTKQLIIELKKLKDVI